jgi:hypothetical protein
MNITAQVYDGKTKALKHAEKIDTSNPEQCLWLMLAIWAAGGNITEGMATISREDKERVFDYLNDEVKFPAARYTKRVEEIHEALGLELSNKERPA